MRTKFKPWLSQYFYSNTLVGNSLSEALVAIQNRLKNHVENLPLLEERKVDIARI